MANITITKELTKGEAISEYKRLRAMIDNYNLEIIKLTTELDSIKLNLSEEDMTMTIEPKIWEAI